MNTFFKSLLAACLLLVGQSALACDYPERPEIPDGTTATKEEMLAAASAVKNYLAAVDTYLNCIEQAEAEAVAAMEQVSPEDMQRRAEMLDKRFAAANEEKALVGEMFNQQVRSYNAKARSDD